MDPNLYRTMKSGTCRSRCEVGHRFVDGIRNVTYVRNEAAF
jgi:hypothetical protein